MYNLLSTHTYIQFFFFSINDIVIYGELSFLYLLTQMSNTLFHLKNDIKSLGSNKSFRNSKLVIVSMG